MKINTLFLFYLLHSACGYAQPLMVASLKCEYKTNPLGIEQSSPKLSWQLQSTQHNVLQTAFRILVSDNMESLNNNIGNTWDSKKTNSEESIQVAYKGLTLLPAKKYFWKVMVWDNHHSISQWSQPAEWVMGLINKEDWRGASWIAYQKFNDSLKIIPGVEGKGDKSIQDAKDILPMLRKEFTADKAIKQATMFICGLGQFELSINGDKIGDHFLDPGWTQYDKQSLYVTFDVTKNLRQGTNAIGVMLGNGFYFIPRQRYRKLTTAFGYPEMICRLCIEYSDGSSKNIISDASWKGTPSPITFSSIYGGEDYNSSLEQTGWNVPAYNDKSWTEVLIAGGPTNLKSQMEEPVKIFEHFKPISVTRIKDSAYVYDLGQNASGIPSITVRGKRGDSIKIIPGELLNANGTVNQKATGSPYYYVYILKGNGVEQWQPRFSYYGFRYVQVEGAVPMDRQTPLLLPKVLQLTGLHTRNSAEKVGSFSCSNELFNKTYNLIDWSIKSNLQSVMTDCPHREKLGWLEEVHLMGSSIRYNYDVVNLLKKIVHDMMDAQTPEGLVPEIAPEFVKFGYGDGMFRDSPEWGSNCVILPWYLYQWYGDMGILKEAYPMMQRYVEYLKSKAKDNILTQGLGDWYDLGPKPPGVSQLTPKGLTATAFYYYDLSILNSVAGLLGKSSDGNNYREQGSQIRHSFNEKYFDSSTNQYGSGSQAANAIAVFMKLVNPAVRNKVVENIVKDIKVHNNALTAGDIGYRYLLQVLEDEGRSDIIFDMNNRDDVPGYGYQLAKGATALTESWQALPNASNNHLMLGHIMEWFYSGIGGIVQTKLPGALGNFFVAFKTIGICPQVVGDLTSAKTNYQSLYGVIVTSWENKNKMFKLSVDIPPNTMAFMQLPANHLSTIVENKTILYSKASSLQKMHFNNEGNRAEFMIGSGHYEFEVKN